MSYVVLARKYRPLRFEDMVGQEHVGRTLANAIAQDRVHHAYLFAGARGLGKTTTARIFAKGLVCEKGPTATPCNECEQCIAVNEGRSVDVVEIDGASNNSVDNIRSLREQVHYLPQSARRKVYIIDEVHMLTTQAFNALLKTLEEPPPHVNFIFATTEPQKVLPTILSRVSRMDFRRLSVQELVAHLRSILEREGLGMDEGALRIVARAAGGSVRDAMTLLDQVIAFAQDAQNVSEDEVRSVLGQAGADAIGALIEAVLDQDAPAVVRCFDELVAAGHDMMVLSMQVLQHLRDLTLVAVCETPEVLRGVTDSEYAALREQAGKADPVRLGQLFDRFTRVVDRLPTSRVPRLLLEMGLLDLAHAEPLTPIGDIISQLRGVSSGSPPAGAGSQGSGPSAGSRRGASGSRRSGAAASRAPERVAAPSPPPPSVPPVEAPAPESRPQAQQSPPPADPGPRQSTPVQPRADGPQAPAAAMSFEGSELMQGLWQMAQSAVESNADETPRAGEGERHGSNGHASARTSASNRAGQSGEPGPAAARRTDPDCGVGPCSERPPRPDVIDVDHLDGFDAWEKLVARIRAETEYVSAVLSDVGLVRLADGVLEVAAAPRSFAHTELTGRPEIRAQVEQATRDHFGRAFRLHLVDGEACLPDCPSIALVEAQRRENHQRAIEAEAREHQALRTLVETFGAKITKTRPERNA